MIDECKVRREPVGFIDPQLVSAQSIEINPQLVHAYLVHALTTLQDKQHILIPYNEL